MSPDKNIKPARRLLSKTALPEEFKSEEYGGERKEIQQLVNSDVEE